MLAVSETFGRADQPQEQVELDGFSSWRTERSGSDKGGGGLCLYYHHTLSPHPWTPQVDPSQTYISNERQWLLFSGAGIKMAMLHIYIACQNTRNNDYLQWNEDLFHLVTQETIKLRKEGFTVFSLGDYNTRVGAIAGLEGNSPDTNNNCPMFLDFLQQSNLVIINTLPVARGLFTRWMDDSGRKGSVLDYGLIDNEHVQLVTSFIIDEHARFSCGSDHALLVASLAISPNPKVSWSHHDVIQYDFNPGSSFLEFQSELDTHASKIPLAQFEEFSAEDMLPHLTLSLSDSGKKTLGIKIRKRKPRKRLPRNIVNMLREKQILATRISQITQADPSISPTGELEHLTQELATLKGKIKDSIADHKLHRIRTLRNKTLKNDPTRRKFWRFLKSQIKSAGQISGVHDDQGQMVFQQHEIEDAVLNHFTKIFVGQQTPVFVNPSSQDQVALTIEEIDALLGSGSSDIPLDEHEARVCKEFTFTELEHALAELPDGKSCGMDNVPNELLKHCSFKFKQYLLVFLNRIITTGRVPEELNRGKCILIFKVSLEKNILTSCSLKTIG